MTNAYIFIKAKAGKTKDVAKALLALARAVAASLLIEGAASRSSSPARLRTGRPDRPRPGQPPREMLTAPLCGERR